MGMVPKMQTHVAVQLFTDMDFLQDPSSSDVIYQTYSNFEFVFPEAR